MLSNSNVVAGGDPFYPQDSQLRDYIPNFYRTSTLLFSFSVICFLIISTTLAIAKWHNPNLQNRDQALVLWFVLCKPDLLVSLPLLNHITVVSIPDSKAANVTDSSEIPS
jgi:hypothetical protein